MPAKSEKNGPVKSSDERVLRVHGLLRLQVDFEIVDGISLEEFGETLRDEVELLMSDAPEGIDLDDFAYRGEDGRYHLVEETDDGRIVVMDVEL